MSTQPDDSRPLCENCGRKAADHWLANATDGCAVGQFFLVCPTNVYRAQGHEANGQRKQGR